MNFLSLPPSVCYSFHTCATDSSATQTQSARDPPEIFPHFKASDILVREAFMLVGDEGEGIVEQIDGVVEIDGYLYLVEMKWWKDPLGTAEVSPHLVKIYNRGHAGGILISKSGYTQPAITTCREALSQRTVVLCELEEFVILLERQSSLKDFLKLKINAAVMDKQPLFKPFSQVHGTS